MLIQKLPSIGQNTVSQFFDPRRTSFVKRRDNGASNDQSTKEKTMKKMLILAAVFGFTAAIAASAADAKANWDSLCAKCHGADGKGQTKIGQMLNIKDFTDAKVQADLKDDAAFKAIKEGLKSDEGKTLMKPFDTLSDDDIKGLVAYVHAFKK
jgi:cytochrome c6